MAGSPSPHGPPVLELRSDYDQAQAQFGWPHWPFNWALDWFNALGASPSARDQVALRSSRRTAPEGDVSWSAGTNQVANWLRSQGVDAASS